MPQTHEKIMDSLGFEPRSPAPSWSSATAPPRFPEPLCSFLGSRSRDSQLSENPSFAALAPPGAGSQQRQACGFPERALGIGGRWLSHRDEITTHLWMGEDAKVWELSELLVDFVHVCKKNKPVGGDFALGLWTAGLRKLLGHDKPLGGALAQVPRRVVLC